MNIQINQGISLETEIPFQCVLDFYMRWEINEHAELRLSGIIDSEKPKIQTTYTQTINITLNEETFFSGIIVDEKRTNSGVIMVTIKASSASIKLDLIKQSRVFQNIEQSYPEIAEMQIKDFSGNVICTVEKQKPNNPVICYQETAWDFVRRMASYQNSFIIPDIITGKPNLWFGMKKGNIIRDNLLNEKMIIEIDKCYTKSGDEQCRKRYHVECGNNYSLGDRFDLYGENCVIYKKQMWFEKGDIRFLYSLSSHIDKAEYYNRAFTGLSLTGIVENINKELVKISFDIGGKDGEYYYPWKPETGNSLYEMPEKGEKVAVYFRDSDERNGMAVRCVNSSGYRKDAETKLNQVSDDTYLAMKSGEIKIDKNQQKFIVNDTRINLSGNNIEINGNGKVRIKAKRITLSATHEIKATAE